MPDSADVCASATAGTAPDAAGGFARESTLAPVRRQAFRRTKMSSLSQILSEHTNTLVLDAASARIQCGWLVEGAAPCWAESQQEAGVGLFNCIHTLGLNLSEVNSFVFCSGPGSILGIRVAAMALRTWTVLKRRPMFAYCSLELLARALNQSDASIIADARRESWHLYRIGCGLTRAAATDLTGDLIMPDGFRHWTPLPPRVQLAPYDVRVLLTKVPDVELFHLSEAPDAFLHEEPRYVTWTPQIHRAPSSS